MISAKRPPKAVAATIAHLNELLDEALQQTFPASDPVAIDVDPIERATSAKGEVKRLTPLRREGAPAAD
jgi:hypothetical protein